MKKIKFKLTKELIKINNKIYNRISVMFNLKNKKVQVSMDLHMNLIHQVSIKIMNKINPIIKRIDFIYIFYIKLYNRLKIIDYFKFE